MSFRAGLHVVMDSKVIRPIETLSREISCPNGPPAIEGEDFITAPSKEVLSNNVYKLYELRKI